LLVAVDLLIGGLLAPSCELMEMVESLDPEEIEEFLQVFGEN